MPAYAISVVIFWMMLVALVNLVNQNNFAREADRAPGNEM